MCTECGGVGGKSGRREVAVVWSGGRWWVGRWTSVPSMHPSIHPSHWVGRSYRHNRSVERKANAEPFWLKRFKFGSSQERLLLTLRGQCLVCVWNDDLPWCAGMARSQMGGSRSCVDRAFRQPNGLEIHSNLVSLQSKVSHSIHQ